MPDYARGALPSPPDPRDFLFDPTHYGVAAEMILPDTVDLRCGGQLPSRQRPVGPVRNQQMANSCVGHAATAMREALRVAAGAPFQRYSPAFTWWYARNREGTATRNVGCFPRDALDSLQKDGACREDADPYDPAAFATPPTAEQIAAARPFRIASYHRVNEVREATQALAAGTPVMVLICVNDDFDHTGPDGIVSDAALACRDPNHEVLLVGYTPDWLLLQNSWGTGWGQQGYCAVPYSAWGGWIVEAWTASLRAIA